MVNILFSVYPKDYKTSIWVNGLKRITAVDTINQSISVSSNNQQIKIVIDSTVLIDEKKQTISKNPFKWLLAWLPAILVCLSVDLENVDCLDYQTKLSILPNTSDVFINISKSTDSANAPFILTVRGAQVITNEMILKPNFECVDIIFRERLCLYKLILAVPSFFFLLTLIGGLINGSYSTVFFSLLLILTNIALYICSKVVLSKKRQKIISKIKKRYL